MKKLLLIAAVSLAMLSACDKSDGGNDNPPVKGPVRTIIVYMSGENNLSDYAQSDINEMIEGMKTSKNCDNLIVFVDRASTTLKPFIIKIGNDTKQPVDTIRKYDTDFYSSDPSKMKEVLEWIVKGYPADDYGLVLWGHANGWIIMNDVIPTGKAPRRAYGVDNGKNSGASATGVWLNIPKMRQVLETLPGLKFIFADCCNMQDAEVAYELKDVAEYIIASPAEITGSGAPYGTIIPDLFLRDDKQMYTRTCDDYYNKLDPTGGRLPISVVKTSGMQTLAAATRSVLGGIFDGKAISTEGLIYYYTYESVKPEEQVLYDMQDFIRAYADAAEYDSWKATFDQAVIYKKESVKWHANLVSFSYFSEAKREALGLSPALESQGCINMFIPLARYEGTTLKYNTLIKQMKWYQAVGWELLGW